MISYCVGTTVLLSSGQPQEPNSFPTQEACLRGWRPLLILRTSWHCLGTSRIRKIRGYSVHRTGGKQRRVDRQGVQALQVATRSRPRMETPRPSESDDTIRTTLRFSCFTFSFAIHALVAWTLTTRTILNTQPRAGRSSLIHNQPPLRSINLEY